MNEPQPERPSGLSHAIGAYVIWGLLPLYLMFLRHVPPFEFVGWRVIFTLPICLIIVALRRQGAQVIEALRDRRAVLLLLAGALLIGGNWLVYVSAIAQGHVLAASLGYYINPLVNVLAGTLFLGDRLNRLQWAAVAVAGAGVSLLAWEAREMLGISLALAGTFCAYGLVRKFVSAGSLPGLTIESAMLMPVGLAIVAWHARTPEGVSLGADSVTDTLLALSGIITAIPLLMFAVAARRMDYSTLGFVQFIAPTIVFLLGLFVFHEPLRQVQIVCFVLIWTAIALFSWDLLRKRSATP